MKIGIGIDTGGTYTDAVAYDFEAGKVLAKGKALTTKQNLTIGIGEAIDSLPKEQVEAAKIVALSTTLATNACVEGKGGRAKLILIGASERLLDWIGADEKYGLEKENILCIDIDKEKLGPEEIEIKIDEALEEAHEWLADADALSIAEVDSMKNGAAGEKTGKREAGEFRRANHMRKRPCEGAQRNGEGSNGAAQCTAAARHKRVPWGCERSA